MPLKQRLNWDEPVGVDELAFTAYNIFHLTSLPLIIATEAELIREQS